MSTAVANAYVKPLAARYLDSLADRVRALGIESELALMISSGGLTHLAQAKRSPVQMLESGPAAGALAACGWKVSGPGGAAERLGMKPSTLSSRLKALGVEKNSSSG